MRFAVGGRWGLRDAEEHFQFVPYDSLLASIAKHERSRSLAIVYDKAVGSEQEFRKQAMEAVWQCYRIHEVQTGRFFDLLRIDPEDLAASRCYSIAGVAGQSPGGSLPASSTSEVSFRWQGAWGSQRSFRLVLERIREGTQLLEAEDVFAGPGWYEDLRFGPGHSGRSFLIDGWEAGRAEGTVFVPEEGRYWVWVRFNQRVLNDAQSFFYVDTEASPFQAGEGGLGTWVRAGEGELGTWVWKGLGPFDLTAGRHTLGVEKSYGQDVHNGLFFDSVVISADEGFDPGRDDLWPVVFDSGEEKSAESRFVLDVAAEECAACTSTGLAPGRYRWRVQVFDRDRLVDALGDRGVWSEYSEFQVAPSSVPAVPGP